MQSRPRRPSLARAPPARARAAEVVRREEPPQEADGGLEDVQVVARRERVELVCDPVAREAELVAQSHDVEGVEGIQDGGAEAAELVQAALEDRVDLVEALGGGGRGLGVGAGGATVRRRRRWREMAGREEGEEAEGGRADPLWEGRGAHPWRTARSRSRRAASRRARRPASARRRRTSPTLCPPAPWPAPRGRAGGSRRIWRPCVRRTRGRGAAASRTEAGARQGRAPRGQLRRSERQIQWCAVEQAQARAGGARRGSTPGGLNGRGRLLLELRRGARGGRGCADELQRLLLPAVPGAALATQRDRLERPRLREYSVLVPEVYEGEGPETGREESCEEEDAPPAGYQTGRAPRLPHCLSLHR